MLMNVPLATLGVLLDLPTGIVVTAVHPDGDTVALTLEGADLARHGAEVTELTAEYAVSAHGHRSFTGFLLPSDSGGGIAERPATAEDLLAAAQARIVELESTLSATGTAAPVETRRTVPGPAPVTTAPITAASASPATVTPAAPTDPATPPTTTEAGSA